MDTGDALTALAAYIGSKEVVEKLLGPTAEYIGDGLRNWTERRTNNVARIFANAHKRLGDKIDQDGTVPPKVLKEILEHGSFCDDRLTAEYFGGVLASSRSEISRDDRGASFVALLAQLSTYQIRSHYIFYRIIKNVFDGEKYNAVRNRVYIPQPTYNTAMDFSELENKGVIRYHVMNGLQKENLIGGNYRYGPLEHIQKHFPEAVQGGLIVGPKSLGVELFLWAHGKGDQNYTDFLQTDNIFEPDETILIPHEYEGVQSE